MNFYFSEAHEWEMGQLINYHGTINSGHEPDGNKSDAFKAEVAFSGMRYISDMAVTKDLTSMFIAGSLIDKDDAYKFVIVKVVDDPDKDSDVIDGVDNNKDLKDASVFFDMTKYFKSHKDSHRDDDEVSISLALDANGNIFATYPGGVAILDKEGDLLATVELDESLNLVPTSIVIGNDGYLYLSTDTALLRWRIKSKPLDYPTNLVVPKRK